MKTLIFGGGGIAQAIPGIKVDHSRCDVRNLSKVAVILQDNEPDVVINCAGIYLPHDFQDEISTNLIGSYNVARAAIKHDIKTMIFLGSVCGLYGKAGYAGYSASKAGVISLVRTLAQEGHNAYCISPGRVDTAMRDRLYPDEDKASRLKPEQIAGVVEDIIAGKYEPGDNVVIRRQGEETIIEVDKGEPWKARLAR